MISVTDLRSGVTFEESGNIFEVLSYEHIKVGRGSASVKVKIKNLRSGAILERGFISSAQVRDILLEKRDYQYLYKDNEKAYFMDQTTFEQVEIPLKLLDGYIYLKDGEMASLRFYGNEPLGLFLPPKVTLEIADTPPGVRGDSASNVYKEARLENGLKTKVPLFIEIGDKIVVDTRDGSYTKRA